jgi:hypothetical protein
MLITRSMATITLSSSSALLVLLLLVTTTSLRGVVGTTATTTPTTTTTSSAKESSESSATTSSSRTAQALRRWIEDAEGGQVHPAVELLPRRVPLHHHHSSPSQTQQQRPSSWWFAAKGPLRKGEVIAVIPDTHVFQPSTTGSSSASSSSSDPTTTTELFSWCDMVAAVDQELERGDSSYYAPLFHHLQEVALDVFPIPSVWSSPSRHLLRQLLSLVHDHDDDDDDDDNDNNHSRPTHDPSWNLPPRDPVEWITHDYVTNCYNESSHNNNENDENDENDNESSSSSSSSFLLSGRSILAAAMTVTWKEEGFRIIPLSSLFLHRNGPYTNVDMGRRRSRRRSDDGAATTVTTAFHVVALRDISPGEFLSWSHNLCHECGRRRQGDYGTAGM